MWAIRGRAGLVVLASLLAASAQAGEQDKHDGNGQGEILFFGSANALVLDSDDLAYDGSELDLGVDVLGSWGAGRFRIFGELLVSTEEVDLERLQIGWEIFPDSYVWLGRFHQPASSWNTRHHHGPYLQPTITRPAIESWEDEGGVLPQHLLGLLAETRLQFGETGGVALAAGAGVAPVITDQGMEPLDLLKPGDFEGRRAWSARVTFLPDFTDDNGIGLVASHSEIDITSAVYVGPADSVDLDVVGLFVAWTRGAWRFDSTLYGVNARFAGQGGASDEFSAGYLQLRRELGNEFSVAGRFEGSADAAGSSYLSLFPDFVRQRSVLDFRWDFMRRQALSIEFAANRARNSDFREFRLQWSAALP
jgi:hypothetical protein